MKVRRSFFIALPLGLLLAAAVYFGLFFLQLGVPTAQRAWLHGIIETKRRIAETITKPKLLIVAGSSALYGISAEEIERQTGFPTVNFGTNASLGPAYMLHLTRKACRPGDVVLLAFEYEAYLFSNLTGDTTDDLFISYILEYDSEYVRSLSLRTQLKLAMLTPGDRLWAGVRAVFQKPRQNPATAKFIRDVLANINSHGDQTGAVPEKRPAHVAVRTMVSFIPAYGFPPSPPGFPPIREFCEWARANNVRVLATFPNICHVPEYDRPAAKKMPAQFRVFYESIGVPVLGDISGSMMPEEQMFDSLYHPMRSAALAHTGQLLVHLVPYLRPRPDGAR
ncbi:MAG: hypothetical protein ABI318_04910 [Chthoniobacteraceae bacterium]